MDDKVGHEIAPARRADRGSLRALVALALVALAAACFHDAIAELVGIWSASPNESHGFLVAVLVPVLVWMQRGSLAHGERDGFGAPAVATFAIAIAAGVAASVAGASSVVAALLPAIVLSAVWVALGREALAALALPICFFWFAVPLWWILTPGLQWLTVQATTLLLAGAGIPAFVDGAVVKIPAGVFEIVGGCAGTNYLVVALTMATLIAFLQRASLREGLRLVAFAASIAIAMNWLRVTLLIAIGQATQMRSPLVSDHFWFGWALFGVALVPIVLRARTLGARHRHATAPPARGGRPVRLAAVATAVAGFAVAVAWVRGSDESAASPIVLPALAGWDGPMAGAANWTPSFAGAAVTQAATYRASGGAVDVYVAQFTRHTRGARLVGFGTSVAGDGWTDGSQPRRVVAPGGRVEERVLVAADGRRRIVWSWYSVRGERVDGAARIRLRLAAAAFGAANRSGVVLLAAECGTADCTGARERLREAAAAGLAALDPGATDA